MRITPLDVRKQEFRKGMRGLDPEEVYAFLTTVADEYEAVLNDNKALRERLLELDDKVQEYRTMERTLRDTLITAERVTVEAKDNARREASIIVKEAQIEAERALRDITGEAMRLRQEVQQLRSQREAYLAKMRVIAESHVNFIDSAKREFEDEDEASISRKAEKDQSKDNEPPKRVGETMIGGSTATLFHRDTPADEDVAQPQPVAPAPIPASPAPALDTPTIPTPTPSAAPYPEPPVPPAAKSYEPPAPEPRASADPVEPLPGPTVDPASDSLAKINSILERMKNDQSLAPQSTPVTPPPMPAPVEPLGSVSNEPPVLRAPIAGLDDPEPLRPEGTPGAAAPGNVPVGRAWEHVAAPATTTETATIDPAESDIPEGNDVTSEWSMEQFRKDVMSQSEDDDTSGQ